MKRRFLFGLIVAVLLFLLIWTGDLGWHAVQLNRIYSQAKLIASDGFDKISPQSAVELVSSASQHLQGLRRDIQPFFPFLRGASILPWVGSRIGQIEPLVVYADELAHVGKLVLNRLQPLIEKSKAEEGSSINQRAYQILSEGQADFVEAAAAVERAAQVHLRIQPDLIPFRYRSKYLLLDEYFPLIQQGSQLLPLLPRLLGRERPQAYLILVQNRDELRATGGFISGIGRVQVERGEILRMEIGDSYVIDDFSKDYPPPPEPVQEYMLAGYWVTRDANWSPDFPTSARQAQVLYTLSTSNPIDGVVAFDQDLIIGILKAVGPVSLPGIPDSITAANVENYMQQAWAPDTGQGLTTTWWVNRKKFMSDLGEVLMQNVLKSRDPSKLVALGRDMLDIMYSGHLLIYLDDPEAEALIAKMGLDGRVNPTPGDFLMLVDSNIGFNKVDAVIERSLSYQVDLSNPIQPRGLIKVAYQHKIKETVLCKHEADYGNTYVDMQKRCYWDYWRVLTASGSRLVRSQASPVPASQLLNKQPWNGDVSSAAGEGGAQVYAGLMVLPTKGRQENILELDLSANTLEKRGDKAWVYRLHLQKQAGLSGLPVIIQVIPPTGCQKITAEQGKVVSQPATWVWEGKLSVSQDFEILMVCDKK